MIQQPKNIKKGQKILVTIWKVDQDRAKKIRMLANVVKDPLFVNNANEISEDFKYIDAECWPD